MPLWLPRCKADKQVVRIDPSAFRTLSDMISDETKGKGRVESMGNVGG